MHFLLLLFCVFSFLLPLSLISHTQCASNMLQSFIYTHYRWQYWWQHVGNTNSNILPHSGYIQVWQQPPPSLWPHSTSATTSFYSTLATSLPTLATLNSCSYIPSHSATCSAATMLLCTLMLLLQGLFPLSSQVACAHGTLHALLLIVEKHFICFGTWLCTHTHTHACTRTAGLAYNRQHVAELAWATINCPRVQALAVCVPACVCVFVSVCQNSFVLHINTYTWPYTHAYIYKSQPYTHTHFIFPQIMLIIYSAACGFSSRVVLGDNFVSLCLCMFFQEVTGGSGRCRERGKGSACGNPQHVALSQVRQTLRLKFSSHMLAFNFVGRTRFQLCSIKK